MKQFEVWWQEYIYRNRVSEKPLHTLAEEAFRAGRRGGIADSFDFDAWEYALAKTKKKLELKKNKEKP